MSDGVHLRLLRLKKDWQAFAEMTKLSPMKTLSVIFLLVLGAWADGQQPARPSTIVTAEERFKMKVAEAESTAVKMYPSINVEGSPIRAEMDQIAVRLANGNDPLLDRPDCGLEIAKMAAAKLGIKAVDLSALAAAEEQSRAEQTAVQMYPDINVEGSALRAEMDKIAAWLAKEKDPLLNRTDCGLRIAKMAAAKLNIRPVPALDPAKEIERLRKELAEKNTQIHDWSIYANGLQAGMKARAPAPVAPAVSSALDPYTEGVYRKFGLLPPTVEEQRANDARAAQSSVQHWEAVHQANLRWLLKK